MHSAMVMGACRNPQVMRLLTVNIEGPILPTVDLKAEDVWGTTGNKK